MYVHMYVCMCKRNIHYVVQYTGKTEYKDYSNMIYRIEGNLDGGNFDGHLLFKYLTENMLTDGHSLSLNAVLP